jgi:very-short-patch-repair endonuclease
VTRIRVSKKTAKAWDRLAPGSGIKASIAKRARKRDPRTAAELLTYAKAKAKREEAEALLAMSLKAAAAAGAVPAFAREYLFADSIGRAFRADFAFPSVRLLVEVQGGVWRRGGGAHSHPSNILRDIDKARTAARLGWYVCPVTTDEVKSGAALEAIEHTINGLRCLP